MNLHTPGAHCAGTGCEHSADAATRGSVRTPRVHGRRVRSGRHTRTAATATTGRRAA